MSFNTNFQFNIAQMNSISQEQDKIKKVSKKQQEKIAERVEKTDMTNHDRVNEAHDKDNSSRVRDDDPQEQELEQNEHRPHVAQHNKEAEAKKEDKVIIFKDKDKGNIIDISG